MNATTLLVLQERGETHRLYLDSMVLGRSQSCDLSFDENGVSRRHCEIVLRPDGILLRDLGSTHGTYVNGDRVVSETMIRCGSVIRLADRGPRLRVLEAWLNGVALSPSDGANTDDPGPGAGNDGPSPVGSATESLDPAEIARQAKAQAASHAAGTRTADAPPSRFKQGVAIGAIVGIVLGVALVALLA